MHQSKGNTSAKHLHQNQHTIQTVDSKGSFFKNTNQRQG